MVRVTGSSTSHKHRVDRAVYENHPSVRRVEDPVLLAFVDVMQSSGSKPKRIMRLLREKTGHNVTLRDVHNMVARMREERRGSDTVEQRLETLLRGFCGRRGNRPSVFVDDESLAQTFTLQTRQMRRLFKAFPERYLSVSLGIYGAIRAAQSNGNESAECLTDAIEAFKFSNLSWEQIRVIVIDKNMGELSLLESHFPHVKVIICYFHLKKYIRSEMAKSEYGGPSSFDMDQVEDAVAMLRTAPTNEDYTKYLKYLYFLLDNAHLTSNYNTPEPKHTFLQYFMKNWDHQKERWAVYVFRSDVPHLCNHTNNRLEASWGHIKEILKPEMPLDECVDTLIFVQAVQRWTTAKG
ncbi:hypothetical protein PI125_g3645 [Phytophthora idaei]|nr:hypothetical protein PI125_g3645 [Phytophthora idaei]KAG3131976.1 hypothetical protein PI126_g19839 [Phytophthora idaei]